MRGGGVQEREKERDEQAELVQQVRANHTKELETLTRRVATLNKTIQSRDTQIIDMEQKLEDANRYLSQFCGAWTRADFKINIIKKWILP